MSEAESQSETSSNGVGMNYLDYNVWYVKQDSDAAKTISPTGRWLETEKVTAGDLPEVLEERFGEVVKLPETPWHEVEFSRVLGGAVGVWMLSCHQISPFNPRGYDFFFKVNGEYIGFVES